ncbi:MAG: hypothetical protein JSS49_11035 [Planctomycetes bacterium]|nr:hypothetical protein [Planctomycetota bacterium]
MSTPVRSGFRMAGPEDAPTAYAHPPLVESWLGVEYSAESEWSSADSDTLRAALGPEWPGTWKTYTQGSVTGRQLTNVMADRALRLTSHGFSFGWLGHGGERYPRYESVRDGFVTVLDANRQLAANPAKSVVPVRWTVCYVNRIPRGTVWSTPGDWSFFNLWQSAPLKGLGVDPVGFHGEWSFALEAERGELKIRFYHQVDSATDETESVWMSLTTSGPVDDPETLFDGMDYGREVIVRGFNELVSADAKNYWGVRPK